MPIERDDREARELLRLSQLEGRDPLQDAVAGRLALDRLDAPTEAAPFYAEHAGTDPRHGKEWLDAALVPLADAHPDWAPRFVDYLNGETRTPEYRALKNYIDMFIEEARVGSELAHPNVTNAVANTRPGGAKMTW
mgnify:CR=1 FL=1